VRCGVPQPVKCTRITSSSYSVIMFKGIHKKHAIMALTGSLSWTYWCHCFEILSHRGDGCSHIMDALLFSDVAWLTHFLSPVTVYCRNSYSQSLWYVRCMRECPVWWTSWLSVGYCGNQHAQANCLELAMCILCVSNPVGYQQSCACVQCNI